MSKISLIGTVGIPAVYGGFETLVEYLTKNLALEHEMTVFCSSKSYSQKLKTHNNAKLKYINLKANGFQSIFYDIKSIFLSLKNSEVLLILGVSGCIILPLIKVFYKNKILINIDGLEWKRAKWNIFIKYFLKFSEKIAVKCADIIISDNKEIQSYIKSQYNVNSKLISYGGDHVDYEVISNDLKDLYPFLNKKYSFKVCRIEPENNVDMILEAFSRLSSKTIVVIGNWDNSDYGKDLKVRFSKFKNIFLLNPIYDQKILNQIRSNCYLYIHGHSAGGTNPSLVEAMSLGLPIFSFGVNYNRETTINKAKYFDNISDLVELLEKVNKNDLIEMGKTMKSIANTSYTWKLISFEYNKLFNQ